MPFSFLQELACMLGYFSIKTDRTLMQAGRLADAGMEVASYALLNLPQLR